VAVGALMPSYSEEAVMAKPARKTQTEPRKSNKNTKTVPPNILPANTPRTKSSAVITLLPAKDGTTINEIATGVTDIFY
jgi:hypothetical protein